MAQPQRRRAIDEATRRVGYAPVPLLRGQREEAKANTAAGCLTASAPKIRVVLCDDHEAFRCGVAEMLSLASDMEVVGEAATHEEIVALVSELRPDVALLDLEDAC
jgi:hypothetical protein